MRVILADPRRGLHLSRPSARLPDSLAKPYFSLLNRLLPF